MEFSVLIPSNVDVRVSGCEVLVRGNKGEIKRCFDVEKIKIEKTERLLKLTSISDRRKNKAYTGTVCAHIRNMIKGVTEGYTYKLKILYTHFPINVAVQGNTVTIKNFLGEKSPRFAKILKGVSVDIKGQEITVTGIDKEAVGQTAANIEQATRIRKRDPRVFGDGIFIVSKGDKK